MWYVNVNVSDVAIARVRCRLRIRLGTAVIGRRRLEKLTDERARSEAGFNRRINYFSKILLEIMSFGCISSLNV